ncbi:MAG: energy transducer TonB [Saprospiraceae bacterium]|nr:energy transducer TonB [Saprospiraceae bacterium]
MKVLLTTIVFCFSSIWVFAQTQPSPDTTILMVADQLPYPLFKTCFPANRPDWKVDSVRRCGELQLLNLLSSNIQYPAEAREKNVQGTVVINFVVEPGTGRISNLAMLRDIGSGCGDEAMRVLKALDEAGLKWAPGLIEGKPVRVRHTLPIKFKLTEALPYFISAAGDTIYTDLDTEPTYKAGYDSLLNHLMNRLVYPKTMRDSCKVGVIEMAVLVRKNGDVNVENVLDFNNLGLDFQWEAMRLANRMDGAWQPATFNGTSVTATSPLRVMFKSDAPGCKTINDKFDQAMLLADEGANLLAQEKPDEAIKKWTEALLLQPDNCELLYYRGTAYINQNKREEACQDYNKIKSIMGITWFEGIRRVVCGW